MYVASASCGFTSETRVTIPFTVTRWPIVSAFTLRIGSAFDFESPVRGISRTSYRRLSAAGTVCRGSPASPPASRPSSAGASRRELISTSATSSSTMSTVGSGITESIASAKSCLYRWALRSIRSAISSPRLASTSSRHTSTTRVSRFATSCSLVTYLRSTSSRPSSSNDVRNATNFCVACE